MNKEFHSVFSLLRARHCLLAMSLSVLFALLSARAEEPGYPRPVSFRMLVNDNLPEHDWVDLVVTDMALRLRDGVESAFKKAHPDTPLLVQINNEGLKLWGTWIMLPQQRIEDLRLDASPHRDLMWPALGKGVYPAIDFPGFWTYEAGADSENAIAADTELVNIKVTDIVPFAPNTNRFSTSRTGREFHQKDVVVCPRKDDGSLDWLGAEFGSITQVDEDQSSITVRRWNTRSGKWPAKAAGAYIAPNANQIVLPGFPAVYGKHLKVRVEDFITPFLPNITPECPRDPRNGLNAAEWLARHFVGVLKNHYPTANGLATDVAAATFHPSSRISNRADGNVDGVVDNFYYDSIDHWALGSYDFKYYLRHGKPGHFEGVAEDVLFTSDGNENMEQRFMDLINGIEVEHSMTPPHARHRFSSNLDRLLVWERRARRPHISFIHHKYPVDSYHGGTAADLKDYMHDNWYRLDMACAMMASGYVGKGVSRPGGPVCQPENAWRPRKGGRGRVRIPLNWDEYHRGADMIYNWLGMPVGNAARVSSQLGKTVFGFGPDTSLPSLKTSPPWTANPPRREGDKAFSVVVTSAHAGERAGFKVSLMFDLGALNPNTEYMLQFRARASAAYTRAGRRYAHLPRNLLARLATGKSFGQPSEALVFTDARNI